jgi:methionyl aminopeptidase
MIDYKTPEELEVMSEGGKILAEVLWEVLDHVKPGVSEKELDGLAEKLIIEKGGEPAFKKVKGYHHATCISTNTIVVHGIPTDYKLKDGDIIGIDCGVFYKGLYTDMSHSVRVRKDKNAKKDEIDEFLRIGEKALDEAVKAAVLGNRIGQISKTIQEIVEGAGYSIVRSLIGHGVGKELHEEPEVPGFLDKKIEKTPELKEGMTIAIEVIYNMGDPDVSYSNNDGWTIATSDSSLSGLYERTVAVTRDGPLVLTK